MVGGYYLTLLATAPEVTVEVLHCHDGDTCRIKINQAVWLNVRLAGIDAPEVKGRGKAAQPLADQAQEFVTQKLKGKQVKMRQTDLDSFNRPIVEFFIDNKLFNIELIKAGFAEAYRGKTKRLDKSQYIAAEEEAQKAKLGIWATSDYVSPSVYRKK